MPDRRYHTSATHAAEPSCQRTLSGAVPLNRYEKSDNVNRRYQNTATGSTKSPILSERNELAKKTIDFLLSLGVFKVETYKSDTRNKTLKAIRDAKEKQNITVCDTFEDYLKAVSE